MRDLSYLHFYRLYYVLHRCIYFEVPLRLCVTGRASVFVYPSGGTPCPIELHSHDPLRYVGDMLAWVHQSLATEKELTTSLLRDLQGKFAFWSNYQLLRTLLFVLSLFTFHIRYR